MTTRSSTLFRRLNTKVFFFFFFFLLLFRLSIACTSQINNRPMYGSRNRLNMYKKHYFFNGSTYIPAEPGSYNFSLCFGSEPQYLLARLPFCVLTRLSTFVDQTATLQRRAALCRMERGPQSHSSLLFVTDTNPWHSKRDITGA